MIVIKLKLSNALGEKATIHDYLLPKNPKKLKGFLSAVNHSELYQKGEVTPQDLVTCSGRMKIGVDKREGGSKYVIVKQYLPVALATTALEQAPNQS